MKKNIKKGFSLAEILIALAIISIIATMGFSIAKRGIERAYDQYIYTGYQGISDAISYANSKNLYVDFLDNNKTRTFYEEVASVLDGKNTSISGETLRFTTPNKIKYTISRSSCSKPIGAPVSEYKCTYYIQMEVPVSKGTEGAVNSKMPICLAYLPQNDYGILIPFDKNGTSCEGKLDISNRMDLLPFYIDDGDIGRKTAFRDYTPAQYYSARDAICKVFSGNIIATKTLFTCPSGTKIKGAIKVANPRKLRPF